MKVSYIIPTLNEAKGLPGLLNLLLQIKTKDDEIIVVDGGSEDKTIAIAKEVNVILLETSKGRAIQMNCGAIKAKGDVLFFIHADTLPPLSARLDIEQELSRGADAGCFRYRFDSSAPLLKLNAFFTRFPMLWCRGGDQGLFIRKKVFNDLRGFDENYQIMEEYEFIQRLKKSFTFNIVTNYFVVSARKYELNNYFRVQWANFLVFRAFKKGASQEKMMDIYSRWLHLPQ